MNFESHHLKGLAVGVVVARLLFNTGGASADASPDGNVGLEEITVTAQRRAEDLQKVPVSITAFSGKTIDQERILNLEDVASRAPDFIIGGESPSAPELTIRGIGSTDREAGSDQDVVVSMDDVYLGRTGAMAFDFFDLERIEVLRGPQGTLYGRNAAAGAVNLITAKPEPDFYAKFETGTGNYDLFEARGVVNQPLSDTLLSKFSFSERERDGTNYNELLKEKADGFDDAAFRGQLKYLASDQLTFLLSGDYSRDRVDGISTKPYLIGSGGLFGSLDVLTDTSPNPRVVDNNILGSESDDIGGVYLRTDYETGPGILTFLTSYRHYKLIQDEDLTGVPLIGGAPGQDIGYESAELIDEESGSFVEDLRFASRPESQLWKWTVGLYYLNEDTTRDQVRDRILTTATSSTVSAPLFAQHNVTNSYAAYGQVTYAVTSKLNVTAGTRYTIDHKDFSLDVSNTDPAHTNSLSPAASLFSAAASDTWEAMTPKFSIDYSPIDDVMTYGTASRGFKSGGYTGLAATQAAAETPFAPEYAWNYEIGSKTRFLDNRVQLNVSGFITDFKDLQLRQRILLDPTNQASAVVVIYNAAEARVKGTETEATALIFQGFAVSASYTYLDAKIVEALTPSYVGTTLPKAPKNSYTLGSDYSIPLNGRGTLTVHGDYRYTGTLYYDLGDLAPGEQTGYGLFDGSLTYGSPDARWDVALWGKNITNKLYRTWAQSVDNFSAFSRYGDPVTFGLSLAWKYK